MNIRNYLINILTLTIIILVIIATTVVSLKLGTRALSIIGLCFEILSLILILIIVNLILKHNPKRDKDNWLVSIKGHISTKVKPHGHWKWLQKPRAIEFLLLFIGITLGLCGLALELIVAIKV